MKVGTFTSPGLTERQGAPHARDLLHFLSARTLGAGNESEIGKRAADGGCLGVLETRDSVYIAITFALRRPSRCSGMNLRRAAIDQRLEGDLATFARYELGVDPAVGKAGIEQLDTLGDGSVLVRTEEGIGFRHLLPRLDWMLKLV